VPVGSQREPRVVPELAGDVDHRPPLVEKKRGERVAEVIRSRVLLATAVEGAAERSAPP
jgi:hypothetical protein